MLHFDGNLVKGPGRPAEKPASFTFLGFTHYLTKTRTGKVNIGRTPSTKSRERFRQRISTWLKANKHLRVREHRAYLTKALQGYYQYFGLRLCWTKLSGVRQRVHKLWQHALWRRSQRARRTCDWATLHRQPWFQLPRPRLTQARV